MYVRELFLAILREHGHHGIENDVGFGEIGGCDFNENVLCFQSYFRMLAVNDGWQGQHYAIGIVDNRIARLIRDNRQERLEVSVLM